MQCLLLLEVLGGSHKHAVDGAVKKLTKLWKEVTGGSRGGGHCCFSATPRPSPHHHHHLLYTFPPQNPSLVEQYLAAILSLEPNQNYAGMLGLLVQFCTSHKEMGVVNQHKASGLTGREKGELGWSCWPQLLASSGACWLSHSGPWHLP